MNEYAVWVATHPWWFLLGVPALAGLASAAAWQLLIGLPPGRRRTGVFLAMAGVSGLIFLGLALAVRQEGGLVAFDLALAQALSLAMPTALLWLMSWFTHFGDRNLLTVLAIGLLLGLLWRRQFVLAAGSVAATAGGGALNWLLKHAFERVRPEHTHGFTEATGWSFPSGHASAAMAVYGFSCYLLLRLLAPRHRVICVAVSAALIAAIGVSRVLLQVHFLSDVVAGFAVSALWLALCVALTEGALKARAAR
ncbi:acid phosphatase [Bordetella genomosp. 1]|uniref:Acid phosphatase n=1 Tax=Bordetella genomosp. 1 TaxID=1395607 RepID=A0A261SQQ7_9BORD|nr:phosphatase PAP2 family protein [Bordetella genomosp. 1]MDQ8032545.1 phosphatase PAP2 family protein [Bordetella sp.]OZI39170.1 acid phosphatase [Bordetella genomosp. 1]OZI65393.1 acid phosphatase [Bordetella genomosp. 1]